MHRPASLIGQILGVCVLEFPLLTFQGSLHDVGADGPLLGPALKVGCGLAGDELEI